jgi:CheY-like chemotaxis protein
VVEEVRRQLEPSLGDAVRLRVAVAGDVGRVRADRGQLRQILLSLASNARDAMPHGGTVSIECGNEDEAGPERPPHVVFKVRDEGPGIDESARERVFDPFFRGEGAPAGAGGLSLAAVHGIVKQSGGEIGVESTPGQGATFVVRLPREAGAETAAAVPEAPAAAAGGRTILLVDDEEIVREMTRAVLDQEGHTVLLAGGGEEAVRVAEGFSGVIDLLVTDVIMPGLSGRDTAARIRAARPGTPVIYVSGYTADVLGEGEALGPGTRFLQKPFPPAALVAAVREALHAAPGPSPRA